MKPYKSQEKCNECGKHQKVLRPTHKYLELLETYKAGYRDKNNYGDSPTGRSFKSLEPFIPNKETKIYLCRNPLCLLESKAQPDEWWY